MMNYTNVLMAWPYWLLFCFPALCTIAKRYIAAALENYIWTFYTLVFVLFVGLRHGVSTDWPNYNAILSAAVDVPLSVGLTLSEPGYALLNWVGANLFGGVYFPNFICSMLGVVPLVIFARRQTSPWVSLFVVFPWLVVVAQMGFTRQGAAVGMIIMLLMALERSQFRRALMYLTLAALLHRTSILFTALVFLVTLSSDKENGVLKSVVSLLWGAFIAAIVFNFDVTGKAEQYLVAPMQNPSVPSLHDAGAVGGADSGVTGGADSGVTSGASFQSAGATLRTGIGFIAAAGYLIFFAFNRKQSKADPGRLVWILMSVAQLLLFPLAFMVSTLADRLSFYLIPLQIHVTAMADAALPAGARPFFRSAVLATYALMFVLWLTRSDFASDWIPYDNLITRHW